MYRKLTQWIVTLATILLVFWDLWVMGEPGATISEVVRDAAAEHTMLAVAIGALVGHWFWAAGKRRRN